MFYNIRYYSEEGDFIIDNELINKYYIYYNIQSLPDSINAMVF